MAGRGTQLFKKNVALTLLEVADTKTYGTGVVSVTYRRKRKAVLG